jgi:hypothetical protein
MCQSAKSFDEKNMASDRKTFLELRSNVFTEVELLTSEVLLHLWE